MVAWTEQQASQLHAVQVPNHERTHCCTHLHKSTISQLILLFLPVGKKLNRLHVCERCGELTQMQSTNTMSKILVVRHISNTICHLLDTIVPRPEHVILNGTVSFHSKWKQCSAIRLPSRLWRMRRGWAPQSFHIYHGTPCSQLNHISMLVLNALAAVQFRYAYVNSNRLDD